MDKKTEYKIGGNASDFLNKHRPNLPANKYAEWHDILKDFAMQQVKLFAIPVVSVSFISLIDRLERASNIKYPDRQWNAEFRANMINIWNGKDERLLERVNEIESEINKL